MENWTTELLDYTLAIYNGKQEKMKNIFLLFFEKDKAKTIFNAVQYFKHWKRRDNTQKRTTDKYLMKMELATS